MQFRTHQPKDTPFFQQKLPAWQPMFTAKTSGLFFSVMALVFIFFGIIVTITSNSLVEIVRDYTNCDKNLNCSISFQVNSYIRVSYFIFFKDFNFNLGTRVFLLCFKKFLPKSPSLCEI